MKDLVSIIIPVHNSELTLKKAIDSVISQDYENWELFVILDHCSDSSKLIASAYSDPRIFVLENISICGAAEARNVGIEKSNGKYLAFLDSDDYWCSEKLSNQIFFMEENHVLFSYTQYFVFGDKINQFIFKPAPCATYKKLLKANFIGCSTVIIQKNVIHCFLMPTHAHKREDFAAWLSILKTGQNAYCLEKPLTYYFFSRSSTSGNKRNMAKYQWYVYRKIEKISFVKATYYLFCWVWNGFWKYRKHSFQTSH